jgi:hypothetical protein
MKIKHLVRQPETPKKTALWKKLMVVFLAIAMPLFFSLVRQNQLQQVISSTNSPTENAQDLNKDNTPR